MVRRFCTAYEHSKCVPSRMPRRIAVDKKATSSPARMVIDTLASGTLRIRARPREALGGLRQPHRLLRAAGRPSKPPHLDRQGSWSHRGELSDGTAPRRGLRPLPARGQRAAIAAPLDEANSAIDATRRRQHKTPQGSRNTAKTQRRHTLRHNSARAQDGRRQQDVEPLRFRTKRVHRQPPQPHAW